MTKDTENLKRKTINSLSLKLIEQFLSLGLQLIISIILARLLSPSDYGIIAIVNVFVVLSNVFLESGVGVALVQKKEISDIDISTTFVSSFGLGIVLYIIIFVFAPLTSSFYQMPELTTIMRVYGITIVVASITSSYNSYLSRKLDYKKPLISTLIACVVSGIIGIIMAIYGFGVWALVVQYLLQRFIYLFSILFFTKFIPKPCFSLISFKQLIDYSWKVFTARFIATIFGQIRNLIIGKQFDSDVLGNYNKGNQYPSTIATAIDYSIQSVMFSVFSKKQDDIEMLRSMLRRSMKMSSYILFPMMIGLAVVAEPLVVIVLTTKWLPCVPFLQIACLMCMLQPVNSANLQAINAVGRSDVSLRLEIVKRFFAIILIVICILKKDVYALAISAVIVELFGWIQYMVINKRVLKYSIKEQLCDIIPILGSSLIMGVGVYAISFIHLNVYLQLCFQVICGFFLYLICSIVMKLDSYLYILDFISRSLLRKKGESDKDVDFQR